MSNPSSLENPQAEDRDEIPDLRPTQGESLVDSEEVKAKSQVRSFEKSTDINIPEGSRFSELDNRSSETAEQGQNPFQEEEVELDSGSLPGADHETVYADSGHEGTFSCIVCGGIINAAQDLARECKGCSQWCKGCLETAFDLALNNGAAYPPRCHCLERIYLESVEDKLPSTFFEKNHWKLAEKAAAVPLYCGWPPCSTFLNIDNDTEEPSQFIECPVCEKKTCVQCRNLEDDHSDDTECPENSLDRERAEILALRPGTEGNQDDEYYHPCACGQIVQRIDGCSHLTCPKCGHEFCADCSDEWPCGCRDDWQDHQDDWDREQLEEEPEDEETRLLRERAGREWRDQLFREEYEQQQQELQPLPNTFLTDKWKFPGDLNVGRPGRDLSDLVHTECQAQNINLGHNRPGMTSIAGGNDVQWQRYMERLDEHGEHTGIIACPHDSWTNTYPHGGECQGRCGGFWAPYFLYRCDFCGLRVCRYCCWGRDFNTTDPVYPKSASSTAVKLGAALTFTLAVGTLLTEALTITGLW